MIKKYCGSFFEHTAKRQEKGPHFREAPGFLGIVCSKLLSSDYASHLTNLV
mgnify:CR=1 FL=1